MTRGVLNGLRIASTLLAVASARFTAAQELEPRSVAEQLVADFHYAANNAEADAEDFATSPLHVGELLQKRDFYLGALGVGLALGAAFALDRPVRDRMEHMNHNLARDFQSSGEIALWGATGALYAYGLYADDSRAREYVLTTLESTALAGLANAGLKDAFGRERPSRSASPFEFFRGGRSFPSGAVTPAFALAAGLSEYGENRWTWAVPAYGAAAAVGLGRMGKNAHWLSDVVGSGLLGVGTTELMLYLHRRHAHDPSRYRIFPAGPGGSAGLTVSFEW